MFSLWVIIICIAVIIVLFLFCVRPRTDRKEQLVPFGRQGIAHRGLFDNKGDAPENSIAAFKKAVDSGYGIELDVQITTDEKVFVFHDDSLKRMCGVDRPPTECSFTELEAFHLASSEEKIPLFSDVLSAIGGRVPLVVEIKQEGNWKRTSELTAEMLDQYEGTYCVESFRPQVLRWYRKNRPKVIRGQLSTNYFKTFKKMSSKSPFRAFLLTNLLTNCISRPDFIAYNHKWADQWGYRICRRLFHVANVAWTIRSPEQLNELQDIFDVFIFDSFLP